MRVSLQHVSQSYNRERLFSDLNLEIPSGKFFSLLGPSGCGKTTILRMLAGFIRVDAGHILFGDRDVTRVPMHRRNTGIVFQDYALFPDRSVIANVCYGLLARGEPPQRARVKAQDMLDRVGLGDLAERLPGDLSGGQKQRVAMARALIIKPSLLLLDEPLSALDVKLRLELRLLIRQLQVASGITTVFVTHDQSEALAMSDGIAVLERGHILQIGSPEEIYQSPSCRFVSDFFGCNRFSVAESLGLDEAGQRLRLTSGEIVRVTDRRPFRPGQDLSVRPTDARLTDPDRLGQDNVLAGIVRQREYRGATIEYIVNANGVECHAEIPSDEPPREIGDRVGLLLPKSGCLVGEEP